MRYFITFAYRGTTFHGWQIQQNAYSVQQAVHEALSRVLGQAVVVMGSGRTDTGVHAQAQVAHFDWPGPPLDATLLSRINAVLPPDVSARQLRQVPPSAHARFSARARYYEYHLHNFKDPFAHDYSYYLRKPQRVDLIQKAAQRLVAYGERDYACFSKSGSQTTNHRCRIHRADWEVHDEPRGGQRTVFRIGADRFLRGMVRAIVGTLLDVGTEETSLAAFEEIVASRDRCRAGRSVPAHGLYLTQVDYDI
ncbi:MAG: tRNA pseudouridine(38-40) synthase TruA [Tunicatimonas sp.]